MDIIADIIRSHKFRCGTEDELQRGIDAALSASSIEHEREYRLSEKDRIDFLCGDVGIEVKTKGALAEVTRQVHRYVQNASVNALVLVTTKQAHRSIPSKINGKSIRVIWLGLQEAF